MSDVNEVYDFDQFIAEAEDTGIPFKAFGKEYRISTTIPLGLVLKFRDVGKRKSSEVLSENDMLDIVEAVFGKEIIDELRLHAAFDVPYMLKMLQWAFDKYGLNTSPKEIETTAVVEVETVSAA